MSNTILNSILHEELKPWAADFSNIQEIKEILKAANKLQPKTIDDFNQLLRMLLKPYNRLSNSITNKSSKELRQLCFSVPIPEPTDLVKSYYHSIITAETLRYFNEVLNNPFIVDAELDVPFQVEEKVLKGIAFSANEANNVLIESGFTTEQTPIESTVQYVLISLRNSLIALYFSIQKQFEDYLTDVYVSEDDFYMYKMDSAANKITIQELQTEKEPISIAQSNNKPFNFGFKGDETKLVNLVKILCIYKNLLDESVTSQGDFTQLLLTKNISDKVYNIQIGCETNLFQYIVDKLKITSPKFTYANIGRCNYFKTKNGNPIQASLLSNSKSNNPVPKKTKEEIDKIFKENDM